MTATTKRERKSQRGISHRPMSIDPPATTTSATSRQVLVATDGSRAASAAIRFARFMERRGSWKPEAITVLAPVPVSMADVVLPMPDPALQQAATTGTQRIIRRQLRRIGASWDVAVHVGSAAPTIARIAENTGASLIVTGLGKHGRLARIVGAETAARVARLSRIPVLAVSASEHEPPYTALVAMDFGDSSVRAAREALELLERPGRLHLLHVQWAMNGRTGRDGDWERTYALGVEQGFARLRAALGNRPGIRVTSELRLGGVIVTLIAVAKEIDADIIAAGSHNQNIVDRVLIGNTPAQLLRAARCSVLIAPPDGLPESRA